MIIKLESVKKKESAIKLEALKRPERKLSPDLIMTATEDVHRELAEEHSADPIKSIEDINRISSYLMDMRNLLIMWLRKQRNILGKYLI